MTAIIKKFFENDSVLVFNENDLPGVGDISQIQSDITDLQTNKADKLQNNLVATTDPTAQDDSSEGYSVLSIWINNSTNEIFKCLSNSIGAAVWIKTTLTIDELGTMALESATNYYTKTEIDNSAVKLTGNQTIAGNKSFIDKVSIGTTTTPSLHTIGEGLTAGILLDGTTETSRAIISRIGNAERNMEVKHLHSTTTPITEIDVLANSDTSTHSPVVNSQVVKKHIVGGRATDGYYKLYEEEIGVDSTGTISDTSMPGKIVRKITPDGSKTPVVFETVTNDGVVTFDKSPIVPTPTTDMEVATKKYVDDNAGYADLYKYQIVTSVNSGYLTVALKNYLGQDPSVAVPVKVQIGDTIRTITSALSCPMPSGGNWSNAGSSELAGKEIDYFTYLFWYDTYSGGARVGIGFSRINGNKISDFAISGGTDERSIHFNWDGVGSPTGTQPVVNIGRFNAILSAGPSYTWSLPSTSVIINRPCFETRLLDWNPNFYASGSMEVSGGTKYATYQIILNNCYTSLDYEGFTIGGTASNEIYWTTPFTYSNKDGRGQIIPAYGRIFNNFLIDTNIIPFIDKVYIKTGNFVLSSNSNWIILESKYNI